MAEFPSEEWLKLYVERINSSNEYREAAATWEGDIAYVFEAEPDHGLPEDVWAWLDLWHGECRDGKYGLSPEEGEKSRFIIRAPSATCRWCMGVSRTGASCAAPSAPSVTGCAGGRARDIPTSSGVLPV